MRLTTYAGAACWPTVIFLVGCVASPAPVPQPGPIQEEGFVQPNDPDDSLTIWDGVFTTEQAIRGRQTATENCIACHPPGDWSRATFLEGWAGGRPLGDLYVKIQRTMPLDDPGRLTPAAYADIIAYMLQLHDAPAGETDLGSALETLDGIIVASEAQAHD